MLRLTAVLIVLLAGCTTLPVQIDKMTPEQIKEYAKIKDANIMCIIANTPYGQVRTLFVNVDRGVIPGGMVDVDDQCRAKITNPPHAPKGP